jgi:hypothetical protein
VYHRWVTTRSRAYSSHVLHDSLRALLQRVGVRNADTDLLQGMDSITTHCHHLLHVLAVDVQQELEEAYPEELSRTPLRMTMFQRPNARARCKARQLLVHKYVHLTPLQRYERAQSHSKLLPRALRLADFLMLGSMLDLCSTAIEVRSALSLGPLFCTASSNKLLLCAVC